MNPCAVTTCPRTAHTRGYCRPHYQRLRRSGDPVIPPSRLIDHVTVDRAVNGEPAGRLTIAEREAVVARLARLGVPAGEIAVRTGLAGRNSVAAIRRRLRAAATFKEAV